MKARDYKNKVSNLGCVMCIHLDTEQHGRTYLHHVREGQGLSQRASDFLVVALCQEHHQGKSGLHGLGTRGFYQRYKLDELDLLAMTLEALP